MGWIRLAIGLMFFINLPLYGGRGAHDTRASSSHDSRGVHIRLGHQMSPDSEEGRPGKRVHFTESRSSPPNQPPQRVSSRIAHEALHPFERELEQATTTHDDLIVTRLFFTFRTLPLSELQWAEIADSDHVLVWPGQSSKEAVGAHLFFNAAFNGPHQNLLRNAMRPLLTVGVGGVSFDDAYKDVTSRVERVMKRHPYFQRRMALFALASATRFNSPLARFFLMRALPSGVDENFRDHGTAAAGDCFREQEAQKPIRIFIDVPGIEAFVDDLQGAEWKDVGKLEKKAALGLVHYNAVLAQRELDTINNISDISDEHLVRGIHHARIAAVGGDWQGCYVAYRLFWIAANYHRLYRSDTERDNMYREGLQFLERAAWHGLEEAYRNAYIREDYDTWERPGTPEGIFQRVKRFLRAIGRR